MENINLYFIDFFEIFGLINPNITYLDLYIILLNGLFLSATGIVFMRSNIIVLLMCIEIYIVFICFSFVLHASLLGGSFGFIIAYILLILAGAESALALSIVTSYYFVEHQIIPQSVVKLKG